MASPRFSILIPTLNRIALLRETIDSVLAQTFSRYEIIVIDNGSTDGTLEILTLYGTRIIVLFEEKPGGDVARNKGLTVATGEYLVLLDNDDLLYPNALEVYDRVIEELQGPAAIFGAMVFFRNGNSPPIHQGSKSISYWTFEDFLSKDVPFVKSNSRILIKRQAAELTQALKADPSAFPADDANLLLLIGAVGPIAIIDKPYTVCYRVHDGNTSANIGRMAEAILVLVQREYLGSYPGGGARKFERYAFLGGCSIPFIIRALKQKRFKIAFKLAAGTRFMIAAAIINKFCRYLRPATPLSWIAISKSKALS